MPTNAWNRTINLGDLVQQWKGGNIDITELAELVSTRIKESGWRAETPYPHTFDEALAELENVFTAREYKAKFEEIYEIADLDRVWIETR